MIYLLVRLCLFSTCLLETHIGKTKPSTDIPSLTLPSLLSVSSFRLSCRGPYKPYIAIAVYHGYQTIEDSTARGGGGVTDEVILMAVVKLAIRIAFVGATAWSVHASDKYHNLDLHLPGYDVDGAVAAAGRGGDGRLLSLDGLMKKAASLGMLYPVGLRDEKSTWINAIAATERMQLACSREVHELRYDILSVSSVLMVSQLLWCDNLDWSTPGLRACGPATIVAFVLIWGLTQFGMQLPNGRWSKPDEVKDNVLVAELAAKALLCTQFFILLGHCAFTVEHSMLTVWSVYLPGFISFGVKKVRSSPVVKEVVRVCGNMRLCLYMWEQGVWAADLALLNLR
jgi:protein-S-isoprenylcysteine O-methyltransferase Ste14